MNPALAAQVDVLVVNQHHALDCSGTDNLDSPLERLLQAVPHVLVTLGVDGSMLAGRGGTRVAVPAVETVAVDTTAAGDTYCGGPRCRLCLGTSLGGRHATRQRDGRPVRPADRRPERDPMGCRGGRAHPRVKTFSRVSIIETSLCAGCGRCGGSPGLGGGCSGASGTLTSVGTWSRGSVAANWSVRRTHIQSRRISWRSAPMAGLGRTMPSPGRLDDAPSW